MIASTCVRRLTIDPACHPGQQPHISAASGLVIAGDWFYIVADDEHHLVALRRRDAASGALQLRRLVEGDVPTDPAARKRAKRDLEALLHLPGDAREPAMLVAWGSGSRPQRDVAYAVQLDAEGALTGDLQAIDLAPLHRVLPEHAGTLNIEAACVQDDALWLFSRANAGSPVNGCFRIDLQQAIDFLRAGGGQHALPRVDFSTLDLGCIGPVPLGITDATALPEGGWLLSAVAEDTTNAYDDGRCLGSVLAVCGHDGAVAWRDRLEGDPKVEGIALDGSGVLWLTTDADDPAVASELRCLQWPPRG